MEIQRYKDCGAVFAEDLGSNNPKYTYVGTGLSKSPWGMARSFNGISDYIIYTGPNLTSIDRTYSFKIKFNTLNDTQRFFQSITTVDPEKYINVRMLDNGKLQYSFSGSNSNYRSYVTNEIVVTINKWHTITISHSGSSSPNVYIDGTLVTSTINASAGIASVPDILGYRIGSSYLGSQYFSGSIKEIIIDNHAWSTQEVSDYHYNRVFDYDKNIISRWNLDTTDTIKDLGWKELGYNGTVNGNPTLSDSPFGRSLVLDGTGDYVSLQNNADFYLKPYQDQSISGWFKVKSLDRIEIIYDGRNSMEENTVGCMVSTTPTENTLRGWVYVGPGPTSIQTSTPINVDTWYHFTFVIDRNDKIYLYLNGELKSSSSISEYEAKDLSSGVSSILGYKSYAGSTINYFNGSIDKVAIFNKALTNIQVKDLMNRQLRGEL